MQPLHESLGHWSVGVVQGTVDREHSTDVRGLTASIDKEMSRLGGGGVPFTLLDNVQLENP